MWMQLGALYLPLVVAVGGVSAGKSHSDIVARHLLGSSFGVPGNATFDYIVVGGGTAGLTIAARLAENGTVAVVEAGSFYEISNGNYSEIPAYDAELTSKDRSDVNPLVDWGFVTTRQAGALNASIHYARGKTLGGCSARNYMAYHRGTRDTYRKWAHQVDDESYELENWLPFFEKSLRYSPPDMSKRAANATPDVDMSHLASGNGPVSITVANYANTASSWVKNAFHSIGISPINGFTSGSLIGSSYLLGTINASTQTRDSSETSFLRTSLNNPNLMVYQSTLGKKILFQNKTQASGLLVESAGMVYTISARKEVVVSAGAFQSPQLLMVSGIGPLDTLTKYGIPIVADRPGVGQNMWDHVFMGISYRVNLVTGSALGNPNFLTQADSEFQNNQSGILTNPGGDWLGFEKVPRNLLSHADQATLSTFPADWPEIEYLSMTGYLGYQQNYNRDAPKDGHQYTSVSAALVAPQSRGTVSISSPDMTDPPVINPNWLTHPTDQAILIAGFKRLRQMFGSEIMRPVLVDAEAFPGETVQTDAQILEIIKRSMSTVFHASATCAMGLAHDTTAVVDSKSRVIGAQGLRVVDISAFPFLPPGHPMATVYALAEKIASDMINGSRLIYGGKGGGSKKCLHGLSLRVGMYFGAPYNCTSVD